MVLECGYNEGDVESGSVNADGNLPSENYNNNNRLELWDMQEKCLVIMAGENKPTFLATPSSRRTTSFDSSSWRSSLTGLTESGSSGKWFVVV
ncbi:putative protein glutamine dumper [Helianthus annuus]|nr:putative protein glutamine dumper [Helianthus annuus]KAJ0877001.1 putative protein glutamine dumper [Helianthus annuus]